MGRYDPSGEPEKYLVWTGIPDQYPRLDSPVTSLNASYNIAVDIFEQCKNKKFALNGQAGYGQLVYSGAPGEGFGVWLRDSVHVALRCGSLMDPLGSGKPSVLPWKKGFDNGSDDRPWARWDFGTTILPLEIQTYCMKCGPAGIKYGRGRQAVRLSKGLVNAEKSTSNDAFPEPENGGYSLSTECYFMKAYESMVSIANVIGFGDKLEVEGWAGNANGCAFPFRKNTGTHNTDIFTSGPSGLMHLPREFGETSGEESVLG